MRHDRKAIYLTKKLFTFLLSVFILSIGVFYISRLAPGDPLVSYYGERVEKMSVEEREWAEEKLGLREPIIKQYTKWLKEALKGNFGISYKYKMDVVEVIRERYVNTLILGGVGFAIIFSLALALGIICVWFENRFLDRFICQFGTMISCIPEFWFSLILILCFSIGLQWLPSSGAHSVGKQKDVFDRMLHLILPLTVVVINHLWYYAYMIRNKMLEEVRADYVLLAKSKGLTRKKIIVSHCLRNMLPTYFSIMAISIPHILGGTYIVETVFSYPGIGTLSYESARYKDYNLLMILCILSGTIVILGNMIAKEVNEFIDPRMKDIKKFESMEAK